MTRLKSGGASPPPRLVHPIGGTITCYRDLTAGLSEAQSVYALRVSGLYDREDMANSLEAMAGDYLNIAYEETGSRAFHLGRPGRSAVWLHSKWPAGETAGFRAEQFDAYRYAISHGTRCDAGLCQLDLGACCSARTEAGRSNGRAKDPRRGGERDARGLQGYPAPDSEGFIRSILAVVENAQQLRRNYALAPYDGDATLIAGIGPTDANSGCAGWKQVLRGRVQLHRLAARHEAIVFPPFSADVAAILNDTMGLAGAGESRMTGVRQS